MSSTTPTIHPPATEGHDREGEIRLPETFPQQPERRSSFPGMEAHRRLFAKIERIIRRYSIDPLATTEEGAYVIDGTTVKKMLEQEVRELSNLDALIPLLRILKEKEWNLNEGDKRIGAYRLVSPTIKDLNDYYLGPNQTDDYIEELHQKIEEILGQNNARVLKSHFKGGVFIIDADRIDRAEEDERGNIEVLEEKLGEIQKVAREVLVGHLKKRRLLLERKHIMKSHERLELAQRRDEPNGHDQQQIAEKIRTLSKEIRKLDDNITELEEMTGAIESGEKSIDIAIGLDKLRAGPANSYLSIRNAECAANIATLQKLDPDVLNGNGKRNGVPYVYLREYSHKELFRHLIRAQHSLVKVLNAECTEVLDDWKPFFIMDEDGYARMNPEMINTYRHLDKYRKGDGYKAMSEEQQKAFEEKMQFFDRYYKTMNIVDFLKNFQAGSIDAYLSDIYGIIALISEAEKSLKEEKPDENRMRHLLEHTSKALEVSLKNDSPVEKRVKTTRAAIKSMMEPGLKIIIFGDNIGFGALNQSAFEQCAIELINMLGISSGEWQEITGQEGKIDKKKLEEVLERKLEALHENPDFVSKMLSFDDEGTKYLRGIEEKLYRLYGGNPVIDADGGDETRAVYTEQNVPGLARKVKDPQRELLAFSVNNNIRIAARVDDFRLPAITTEQIQEEQRRKILELIHTMEEAEEAHTEIKALNIRGQHRIILI